MKKLSVMLLFVVSLFVSSCIRESEVMKDREDLSKDLFYFAETEYTSVNMNVAVNPVQHSEFYSPSVADMVSASEKSVKPSSDNITYLDNSEIPIWRYNKSLRTIYMDGTLEYEMESRLVEDTLENIIFKVASNVVDFKNMLSKVVYKSGIVSMYNSDGKLLYSKHVPQPDMSEFRDTVGYYIRKYNEKKDGGDDLIVHGKANDIEGLKRKLNKMGHNGTITKIENMPNGMVMVESNYSSNVQTKGLDFLNTSEPSFSRNYVSADFDRIYKSQTFLHGQLVNQNLYYYSNDIDSFGVQIRGYDIKVPSFSGVVSQSLVVKDGIPMIETNIEEYTKNRTIFYNAF